MMEPTKHHKAKYGNWAGEPEGRKPDPACCAEEVHGRERWGRAYQCQRKRGHGPDGAYCKQHDPAAVEARRKKVTEREAVRTRKWLCEAYGERFFRALKEIAEGHNDPRALARVMVDLIEKG